MAIIQVPVSDDVNDLLKQIALAQKTTVEDMLAGVVYGLATLYSEAQKMRSQAPPKCIEDFRYPSEEHSG